MARRTFNEKSYNVNDPKGKENAKGIILFAFADRGAKFLLENPNDKKDHWDLLFEIDGKPIKVEAERKADKEWGEENVPYMGRPFKWADVNVLYDKYSTNDSQIFVYSNCSDTLGLLIHRLWIAEHLAAHGTVWVDNHESGDGLEQMIQPLASKCPFFERVDGAWRYWKRKAVTI